MQKKILVLDDDPLVLFSLQTILTDEGYLVFCIQLADLIFSSIDYFVPDLILIDIRLDGADGRAVCDGVKSNPKTGHIPIIMLTALSHQQISEVDCQADAIIGKSFQADNLLRTIKEFIAV